MTILLLMAILLLMTIFTLVGERQSHSGTFRSFSKNRIAEGEKK